MCFWAGERRVAVAETPPASGRWKWRGAALAGSVLLVPRSHHHQWTSVRLVCYRFLPTDLRARFLEPFRQWYLPFLNQTVSVASFRDWWPVHARGISASIEEPDVTMRVAVWLSVLALVAGGGRAAGGGAGGGGRLPRTSASQLVRPAPRNSTTPLAPPRGGSARNRFVLQTNIPHTCCLPQTLPDSNIPPFIVAFPMQWQVRRWSIHEITTKTLKIHAYNVTNHTREDTREGYQHTCLHNSIYNYFNTSNRFWG